MTISLHLKGVYFDRLGRAWKVIRVGSLAWLPTAGKDPCPYLARCEGSGELQWFAADGYWTAASADRRPKTSVDLIA